MAVEWAGKIGGTFHSLTNDHAHQGACADAELVAKNLFAIQCH